jgi:serine/threonine protein kinase
MAPTTATFPASVSVDSESCGSPAVLHVYAEEELLLCYSNRAEEPLLVHRLTLIGASAGLASGSRQAVSVVTAAPDVKAVVAGLTAAPAEGEGATSFDEGAFRFELQSESEARDLLSVLQRAGCIMWDLAKRYRFGRLAGRGSFGDVYEAEDSCTGEKVAVKLFTKRPLHHVHPLREATMLRWADHPALLGFRAVYKVSEPELLEMARVDEASSWAIVTEFVSGKELFDVIQAVGHLQEESARDLARQLIHGLSALHQRGIIHRDVKVENALVQADGGVKLVDFGLATPVWDTAAASVLSGSPGHMAPELLRKKPLSPKADCFGVGVLLFSTLCGRRPFPGKDAQESLRKNCECTLEAGALAHLSPGASDFVGRLLCKDPEMRLSASECLVHPWLAARAATCPPGGKPRQEPPARSGVLPRRVSAVEDRSFWGHQEVVPRSLSRGQWPRGSRNRWPRNH